MCFTTALSVGASFMAPHVSRRSASGAAERLPERATTFRRVHSHLDPRRIVGKRRHGDAKSLKRPGSGRIVRVAPFGVLDRHGEVGANVDAALNTPKRQLGTFDRRGGFD